MAPQGWGPVRVAAGGTANLLQTAPVRSRALSHLRTKAEDEHSKANEKTNTFSYSFYL